MKQGFALGLDAEDRMAVGMARGGDDRDRAVEDLIAVFMDDQVGLERVERTADILDHLLDVVGAVRLREVGLLTAPEVDFLLEDVYGRVGKENLTATGEAADMVDVRVAEQGVGHVFELDADGVHRVREPAPVLVLVGAETGVDEDHFLILTQEQDIDVERHVVRTFADGHEGLGHLGTFVWRPHLLCYPFGESAVAVADGPCLELADREFIDVRIRNRLFRDRITCGVGRGLGGAEGGRNRQGGEGGAKASEELTAGVFGEGAFPWGYDPGFSRLVPWDEPKGNARTNPSLRPWQPGPDSWGLAAAVLTFLNTRRAYTRAVREAAGAIAIRYPRNNAARHAR